MKGSMLRTAPTQELKSMTVAQLEADGWTIDRNTYPWTAYRGPRFAPTEWFCCYTPAFKP